MELSLKKFINEWSLKEVETHLKKTTNKEYSVLSSESAGEGNMNYAFRVGTDKGTLIIKQSPPFCAKFPSIPAPEERIHSELRYYLQTNAHGNLKKYSPSILGFDPELLILYMSDLGEGADYEGVYSGDILETIDLKRLVIYLKQLHTMETPKNTEFQNNKMRKLNSDYIFNLPFDSENKSINLDEVTPGLEQLCNKYKIDKKLKEKVYELKEVYWRDTKTLIHGDYYPRSWLKTPKGLFVIDPEFAFYGQPEFDLSVFISHMEMSSQGKKVFDALKENYGSFNESLTLKLAAVEIFRRIMFVSQLPLVNDLALKSSLLERSYRTIMGDDPFIFFGENQ
jgi:5-methylthioribose kinase